MNSAEPSLFIGSSKAGLPAARALQAELDDDCEAVIWQQNAFAVTDTTISELLARAKKSDFAALILTPENFVVNKAAGSYVATDNVIFEVGIFLGALGPKRVFIIHPRDKELALPSDLAGVTCLTYRSGRSNLQAAIGPAATKIRNRIAELGPRLRP